MFVLVPLKDKWGNSAGVAGGEIDPTNPALTRMLGLPHWESTCLSTSWT